MYALQTVQDQDEDVTLCYLITAAQSLAGACNWTADSGTSTMLRVQLTWFCWHCRNTLSSSSAASTL